MVLCVLCFQFLISFLDQISTSVMDGPDAERQFDSEHYRLLGASVLSTKKLSEPGSNPAGRLDPT